MNEPDKPAELDEKILTELEEVVYGEAQISHGLAIFRIAQLIDAIRASHSRAQSLQKSLLDEMVKSGELKDALRATRRELGTLSVWASAARDRIAELEQQLTATR